MGRLRFMARHYVLCIAGITWYVARYIKNRGEPNVYDDDGVRQTHHAKEIYLAVAQGHHTFINANSLFISPADAG